VAGEDGLNFAALVSAIQRIHEESHAAVSRVVNTTLTLRNWMIGAYIVDYEMHGSDRASYGEELLDRLAQRLQVQRVPTCERRRLYVYRQFFQAYPQMGDLLPPLFAGAARIVRSATALSVAQEATGDAGKVRSVTAQLAMPANKLLNALSFTHFELLLTIDDPLKRAFYEIECIRGNWSVRSLKRQIATLYFERSGLSKNKEKLAEMVHQGIEAAEPQLAIRDPYFFEFLGCAPRMPWPNPIWKRHWSKTCASFCWSWATVFAWKRSKKAMSSATHAHLWIWLFTTPSSNAMCWWNSRSMTSSMNTWASSIPTSPGTAST